MSGKRDESPEKKKKKVDRTKCHFKQEWKVINKELDFSWYWQYHEKSSYTYYRPLSYHVVLTGRRRLRYDDDPCMSPALGYD